MWHAFLSQKAQLKERWEGCDDLVYQAAVILTVGMLSAPAKWCQKVTAMRAPRRDDTGMHLRALSEGRQQKGAASVVTRRLSCVVQAAGSKAAGDAAHALDIITAIRAQQPQHARAHFAAGQLHADLQQWQLAEEAYVAGANLEADMAQRARCLLGAGE